MTVYIIPTSAGSLRHHDAPPCPRSSGCPMSCERSTWRHASKPPSAHGKGFLTSGYIDTRGALGGTRTPNLLIRSQMLYPLSYERWCLASLRHSAGGMLRERTGSAATGRCSRCRRRRPAGGRRGRTRRRSRRGCRDRRREGAERRPAAGWACPRGRPSRSRTRRPGPGRPGRTTRRRRSGCPG